MRKVLGGVLLCAGVGGLGWFASSNHAARMEASITQAAADVAAQAVHGVTATVSGRDIKVSGVSEAAEIDDLMAQFDTIAGRRIVDQDELDLLTVVDPFEMRVARNADAKSIEGVIPSEADREALRPMLGDEVDELTLADGEPDADWGRVAVDSYAALGTLVEGEFVLSGTDLAVTGTATTPSELAALEAALTEIPENYTTTLTVDVLDDGTPMQLDLAYDGETFTGTGKVPVDFDLDGAPLTAAEIAQARIPAENPDWNALATAGVISLGMVDTGTLLVTEESFALTGQMVRTPQPIIDTLIDKVKSSALTIAPDYEVNVSVTPYDDGEPFSLDATFDGETITASGKVPADFANDLNAGASSPLSSAFFGSSMPEGVEKAFITDDTGTWPAIGHAGLNALVTLEEGTLSVTEDGITLSGTAASPQAYEATKSALGDYVAEGEIAFRDDGAPIGIVLTYANDAASVSGKLPADVTSADVSEALGFDVIDDGATQSLETSDTDLLGPLAAITDALPEINSLTYTNGPDGAIFDAVAAPGVDADQLAALLTTKLGDTAQVSVGVATDLPANGATRTNRFTGQDEVFASGHWLPTFDFQSSIEACTAQSDAILAANNVQFLSGSAQLDVPSIRAINGLAALVRKCALEAGLFLQVDGHTDNTGDATANLTLSQARADTVRDAILVRGVTQSAVAAAGYGDSQPVADNDTDEGRAANRRTEFSWVFE